MQIEILYIRGCPNHQSAVATVQQALSAERITAEIAQIEISDSAMAEQTRFPGSPTIRVDGQDVEPGARSASTFGYCCRTYGGAEASAGWPPLDVVRSALREAAGDPPPC